MTYSKKLPFVANVVFKHAQKCMKNILDDLMSELDNISSVENEWFKRR